MICRITDGTTTISLCGGTNGIYGGEEYVPQPPPQAVLRHATLAMRDGERVVNVTRQNVTESTRLVVTGATKTAVLNNMRALESLLSTAEHYQEAQVGTRVWLEIDKDDSENVWRSELFRGVVEPEPGYATDAWLAAGGIAVVAGWERNWYWESQEYSVSLSNQHGSGTSGVTVYNHDDSGHDNWVSIAGASVGGVLPAACRVRIYNSYNSVTRAYTYIIGHNAWAAPASLNPVLEAEDAYAHQGTVTAGSSYSGGYYVGMSWAGTTYVAAVQWTLSTAMLATFAGGWFRAWLRTTVPISGNNHAYLAVKYPAETLLTTVAETPPVLLDEDADFHNLGILQIPPWLKGETSQAAVNLVLYLRNDAGSANYNVDYLALVPTDSYRVLYPRGYGSAFTTEVVDDGMSGVIYTTGWAGGGKTGHYLGRGMPVQLWPGRTQKLYFYETAALIERTMIVYVNYRQRRLTL